MVWTNFLVMIGLSLLLRNELIFAITYNTVVAVHVQVLIVSVHFDAHIHWDPNRGSSLSGYFCSFVANSDLFKM